MPLYLSQSTADDSETATIITRAANDNTHKRSRSIFPFTKTSFDMPIWSPSLLANRRRSRGLRPLPLLHPQTLPAPIRRPPAIHHQRVAIHKPTPLRLRQKQNRLRNILGRSKP